MVYKDFLRINALDSQILSIHQQLSDLYAERKQLLEGKDLVTTSGKPEATEDTLCEAVCPRKMYEEHKNNWLRYDIKLPPFPRFQALLEAADTITRQIAKNPTYAGHLHIVCVPPKGQVLKALQSKRAPRIDSTLLPGMLQGGNTKWRVVAVFDKTLQQHIIDFKTFLETKQFEIEGLDMRGLGVVELLAAHLQNILLTDKKSWVSLMTESTDYANVPCATLTPSNILKFSIDDSGGMLGQNYFNPAVAIKL